MENGGDSKDPSGFLSEIIGAPVTVKLNSSVVYRGRILGLKRTRLWTDECQIPGVLSSVDGYMNIALEKTEEYVDGQLRKSYGDAFVRGNNGVFSRVSGKVMNRLISLSPLYFGRLRVGAIYLYYFLLDSP